MLLGGLCRATGASGSILTLRSQCGKQETYTIGAPAGSRLVLQLQPTGSLHGRCELFGAGSGPAASPAILDAIRPLLESAVGALADCSNAAIQVEVLSEILGVKGDASLLVSPEGEILWANPQGEEALAFHTQRPEAHLDGESQNAPLFDLLVGQMRALRESGERNCRRVLTAWGEERWIMEIMALPGFVYRGCCLVALRPVRMPSAEDLRQRLARHRVSRREAQVLSLVLAGHKAAEIASQLRITEYTVKDHLKHAYSKLGITSRNQLLNRLALAPH